MKKLSCKDLGMNDDFTATGETNNEVKRKMWEHAEKAHRDTVNSMTNEDKQELENEMDDILAGQR